MSDSVLSSSHFGVSESSLAQLVPRQHDQLSETSDCQRSVGESVVESSHVTTVEQISINRSDEIQEAERRRGIDNVNSKSKNQGDEKDVVLVLLVFILEFILFVCMLIAAYFLRFQKDLFRPYFFPLTDCEDPHYSYQYLEDPDDTNNRNIHINHVAYYCVVFLCPLFVIIMGEILYHFLSEEKARSLHIKSFKITTMPRRTLRFSAVFLIGIFVTSIFTDSLKLVAARPRPHFLTVCQPNLTLCDHLPVTSDGICNGNNTAAILEARMSFPSFYCSCTMYVGVFMAIYLHAVLDLNAIYTLRPMFVGASIILGFMGGYTRYQLNYLHWEDMVIGYLIGAAVAVYLACYMASSFKEKDPKKIIVYHKVIPDLKLAMMRHHRASHAEYHKYGDDRPFTNLPNITVKRDHAPDPLQYTHSRTRYPSIPSVTSSDRKRAMEDPELPRRDSEEHYVPFVPPDYGRDSPC